MTKAELMQYVGKKVTIYLKGREAMMYGTLEYVDDMFLTEYGYHKTNYFYIDNIAFKVSHVRKLEESEVEENG